MTQASGSEAPSSGRARDRWRKRTASAKTATETTEAPALAQGSAEVSPDAPRARNAPTRPGAKEFVRANMRALGAIVLLVVGVVFVILGWYGAAHTNILTEQIPYLISGGLLGVALIIVAGFLSSSASLERENRELRNDLLRAMSSMGTGAHPVDLRSGNPSRDGEVFVVPGGRSYHFPGCPIIEGKETSALALPDARRSGYESCKLCGLE